VPAKKGVLLVGKTKRGKGTRIMAIADAYGFPVAAHVENFLGLLQLGCSLILLRNFEIACSWL
jgi:2-succinyl-5-enolpyruvyl-6-hydroxy-3-cyclohexene-1-carboxylate synthase